MVRVRVRFAFCSLIRVRVGDRVRVRVGDRVRVRRSALWSCPRVSSRLHAQLMHNHNPYCTPTYLLCQLQATHSAHA